MYVCVHVENKEEGKMPRWRILRQQRSNRYSRRQKAEIKRLKREYKKLLEENIVFLKKCIVYADVFKSLIQCYTEKEETEIDGDLQGRADEESHPLPVPVIDLTGIE